MHDTVNHPKHYNSHPSGVECITVTEHMSFNLGNAVKYIWRADEKGNSIEDLRKAAWYVNREIARRQAMHQPARSEPDEDHAAGRSTGRTGRAFGNALCGALGPRAGEDANGGGDQSGEHVHDERVSRQADKQPAQLPDDVRRGVEKFLNSKAEQLPVGFYTWPPHEQRAWLARTMGDDWYSAYEGGTEAYVSPT